VIGDALNILSHAQAEYRRALRAVDGKLQAAVASDPTRLDTAKEIQRDYVRFGYEPVTLAALVQPPSTDAVARTAEPAPFKPSMVNAKPEVGDGGEPIIDTPPASEKESE
jgi:hypothetical protein